jgi:Uncharacterized protein conserved in bacteria
MSALESLAIERTQALINHALRTDPGSLKALDSLSGKRIAIHNRFPDRTLSVEINNDSTIALSLVESAPPNTDVVISGLAPALIFFMIRGSDQVTFADSGVEIRGNTDLLITLGEILKNLDIDWEQELAGVIGDTPAHLAGEAVRQTLKLNKQAAERATSGLSEFIREESGLGLNAKEAAVWARQVAELAKDTDRLAARVDRLKARLTPDADNA